MEKIPVTLFPNDNPNTLSPKNPDTVPTTEDQSMSVADTASDPPENKETNPQPELELARKRICNRVSFFLKGVSEEIEQIRRIGVADEEFEITITFDDETKITEITNVTNPQYQLIEQGVKDLNGIEGHIVSVNLFDPDNFYGTTAPGTAGSGVPNLLISVECTRGLECNCEFTPGPENRITIPWPIPDPRA